jgi:DNA-binding NtrC family response regulator
MAQQPERILIVEDEDTLCESLQRVFRREGYEAHIADSAETAFRLLEDSTFDLIITDVILPGISGIELISRYKERNPDQKVIIMTAYASLQTAVEALRVGASDFIVKPIMHDELKRMVKKTLGR